MDKWIKEAIIDADMASDLELRHTSIFNSTIPIELRKKDFSNWENTILEHVKRKFKIDKFLEPYLFGLSIKRDGSLAKTIVFKLKETKYASINEAVQELTVQNSLEATVLVSNSIQLLDGQPLTKKEFQYSKFNYFSYEDGISNGEQDTVVANGNNWLKVA